MNRILLPALALGAMGSTALAEPMTLTDAQMDAVTAGQDDPVRDVVKTQFVDVNNQLGEALSSLFANPDFRRGVAVLDPNDPDAGIVPLIRGFADLATGRLELILDTLDLIKGDDGTDGGVVVVRPEIVSNRVRLREGGVFDRLPGIPGSSLGQIPTVVTGSGPS